MARRKARAGIAHSKNKQEHFVEESFDDNLLPDVGEIERLSQLDPDIMTWLKSRAEKEQDFRHKAFDGRVKIISKNEKGYRWINYLGLFFSFLLLGGGMFLSYYLISEEHEIIGTVFSGAMLVAIASLFMSKVRNNNPNSDNKKIEK